MTESRPRSKQHKRKRKKSKNYLVSYRELVFTVVMMYVCYNLGFYSSDVIMDCYSTLDMDNYGSQKDLTKANEGLDEIDIIEALVEERVAAALEAREQTQGNNRYESKQTFPDTMSSFAHELSTVSQAEFLKIFDYGTTPNPISNPESSEALILYKTKKSIADAFNRRDSIPKLQIEEATKNCESLDVIFQHPKVGSRQCLAILGNYENYHVQKWMRLPKNMDQGDSSKPEFRAVGRAKNDDGYNDFRVPEDHLRLKHQSNLHHFLSSYQEILNEIRPIAESIVVDNTIIVMTVNRGQIDLLINFACSVREKDLDIGNVFVFSCDGKTHEIVKNLGLTSYYDERNFGKLALKQAKDYGDAAFVDMMYAKTLSTLLMSALGYDILFQDVDVVWYKNPLNHLKKLAISQPTHDILLSFDGNNGPRFSPSSANSGFFYARNTSKSRYLFNALMYAGDQIMECGSHQQVLISLINEHSSLFGLRSKILSGKDFPGGFHFHRDKVAMKSIILQKTLPFIFHMSWTNDKTNKVRYLKQMGLWFVKEECENVGHFDIETEKYTSCCSKEPLFSCHYKDKPSLKPCIDSPTIDKHGVSFW